MGALCCCPCGNEFDELSYTTNLLNRNCISLRCLFHRLLNGVQFNAIFHRLEGWPVASTLQGATSLVSSGIDTALTNTSLTDTGLTLSRSVSQNQRYARLTRDGLVFRRDKSMTNLQEDPQQLRRNKSSSSIEAMGYGKKWSATDSVDSQTVSAAKSGFSFAYAQASSEDEDVCPTCLDEYTPENPQITTRCNHHFHLGCIYEWLERSDSCPICGKEMEFCESP